MKLSRLLGCLGLAAPLLLGISPAQAQPPDTSAAKPDQAANGHWYQLVDAGRNLSFTEAMAAAEGKTYQGLKGHLATITSVDEQIFIIQHTLVHLPDPGFCAWIGGTQKPNSAEPDGGWTWITGEEMKYKSWGPGEPNNAGGSEYLIQMRRDGIWNDVGDGGQTQYYVVEYEDPNAPAEFRVTEALPKGPNGHWYQLADGLGPLSWEGAKASAEARSYQGFKGHLATITSRSEQDFITDKIAGKMSHGGDVAYLGGIQKPNSPEPDGGWTWVTGEPFRFVNWEAGEPNDAEHREYLIQIHPNGTWNDVGDNSPTRYFIVEFESPETAAKP